MSSYDPTSYCDGNAIATKHLHITWNVDFNKRTLDGRVQLKLEARRDGIKLVVLDTKDLNIKKVSCDSTNLKFALGTKHKAFGSPLTIHLTSELQGGEEVILIIDYETSANASGLQWLDAQQTAGKKYPYMFSQCQAIHARSIVPCQDSPSMKASYTAKVKVAEPHVVLMSALSTSRETETQNGDKVAMYHFEQKVPIPSYLIAIVVGLLESREIGPRSKVWSEKEMVDAAAFEFSETEQMLAAGEELVGPYVWGRYDLLVLPPSFPYGGMENPCLTFVTPTLLAGDRSLANVVAHEIAHSWTGNLVTNHTWQDFWLNEGHTVFLERKIVSKLQGEQMQHFQALNGFKDLVNSIETFGSNHPFTHLVVTLDDVDPDDSFSRVPYEKGFTLLFYLETLLGGPEIFESFLKSYIEEFKFKSATTPQWKDHLYKYFAEKRSVLDTVDWSSWFNSPGLPPVIPEYDRTLSKECTSLAERWSTASAQDLTSFQPQDVAKLSAWQKIEFLSQLLQKEPLTIPAVRAMDQLYNLSGIGNCEIRFRWLRLGLRSRWEEAIKPALKMAVEQGRMKFTRPLFRDLGGWEKSRERAIQAFTQNQPSMHSTTAQLVKKDLKI